MEIKKIRKNQVEFILTKADLSERGMELADISYDSEKSKELFKELTERAILECSFHANADAPLDAEVIMTAQESLIITVTKPTKSIDILYKFKNKIKCRKIPKNIFEIEKVSENQIKVTLTKTDLIKRKIKLSELSYDSEKRTEFFRKIVEQARFEYDFNTEGSAPFVIEAIPHSEECLIIIITKNAKPMEINLEQSVTK